MIQIYTAGELTYDSRLQTHNLLALGYTAGLNKAGTATITLPPGHPAYNNYDPYKPVVTIYDDEVLVFRGRPLKPDDDTFNRRTITCEGERCFFRDAFMRPYLHQTDPATIFTEAVGIYNEQVEEDKRFVVGTITVTDPNGYVRLENNKGEQVSDTLDKLVERCGGYITFTTNDAGARVVNWLERVQYSTNQSIEFGSNLLERNQSTANDELATRIVPYGATDEETGLPITIESVNNGLDYIEDAEAIALRGIITKPVYYDDVTEPANLLRKAQADLAARRNLITSLTLSATDLSALDKKYDAFREGDLIRVTSKPHGLDDSFLLTDRSVNLLDKSSSTISLGKEQSTLTGLTTAGDKASKSELLEVERRIKADYKLNEANILEQARLTMASLIEQTAEAIRSEVAEAYATNGDVESAISTVIEQTAQSITLTFNELQTYVDENDAEARNHIAEQQQYIRFENGIITLGEAGNAMTLELDNDMIVFKRNGATFGWWDGVDFHTGNIVIEVQERAQFGNFAAIPRKKGNLSWLKVK